MKKTYNIDSSYKELLKAIIKTGYTYDDPYREGVTRKEVGYFPIYHSLIHNFPAISVKKLFFKSVVDELLWFLSGSTNLNDLQSSIWEKDGYKFYERKCKAESLTPLTFEEWKKKLTLKDYQGRHPHADGDLGRIYPAQWRNFTGCSFGKEPWEEPSFTSIDQISNLIHGMRTRPLATDLCVTAWNPAEMHDMALPPCHYFFQILGRPLTHIERASVLFKDVENLRKYQAQKLSKEAMDISEFCDHVGLPKYGFDLEWEQRSVDTFLGLPFNIASYALLAVILGRMSNMTPLGLIGSLKKVHLYDNALEEAKALFNEKSSNNSPELVLPEGLNFNGSIDEFLESAKGKAFTLDNYTPRKAVRVSMLARD